MKHILEYLDFIQSAETPDQLAVISGKFIEAQLGQKQFNILKHRHHSQPFSVIYDNYTGFNLNNWIQSFYDFKEKISPFKPQLFENDYVYFLTDRHDENPIYLLVTRNKFPDKTPELLAVWQKINSIIISAQESLKSELSIEHGNLISQLTHDVQTIITLCEETKKSETLTNRLEYQEKVNNNLLFVAREPELLKTKINLADLIDSALELINVKSEDISLTISGKISDIEVDVELFARALNEIVKNAIAAVDGDLSDIAITAEWQPSISPFLKQGWVVIKVRDNGPGIAGEFHSQVTEAFFTTAKSEGSTGFGLTIARKIIRAHNGHLEINSKQNAGTTVLIFLPQIRDE